MNASFIHFSLRGIPLLLLILVLAPGLMTPAAAADVEMTAYLGETITLHGVSYVGDTVYLFMTGPGLPANGVTLTNTDLRADQGQFTVVGVDNNQEWTYIWKTYRISSEIDPGTYTVYVTNEPVDLAHLGGPSSYKTLSVFLKDSGESRVSIGSGSYTLNPEEDDSTPIPAPSINITTAMTTSATPTPSPTVLITSLQTPVPTTRAGTGPLVVVSALLCCAILVFRSKSRR